ncbi:MAG TPA: PqiC family protein [Candidatus Binataceae bacterium]|nr:PqiC family protein [Candidatus Binataceae bacterium]
MNLNKKRRLMMALTALIALSAGCSVLSPQEDRTRYFVLTPTSQSSSAAAEPSVAGHELSIGLGPITLPRYLQRPEVITRLNDTEFSVADHDRWGEPLDASVSRVLTQDLSSDLPNSQIVQFPWSKKIALDYRISVDFSRLERAADGKTMVQALWTIRTGKDNQLVQKATTTAIGNAGNDQNSASAALSQGIGQVSREIANSVEMRQNTQRQARSATQRSVQDVF